MPVSALATLCTLLALAAPTPPPSPLVCDGCPTLATASWLASQYADALPDSHARKRFPVRSLTLAGDYVAVDVGDSNAAVLYGLLRNGEGTEGVNGAGTEGWSVAESMAIPEAVRPGLEALAAALPPTGFPSCRGLDSHPLEWTRDQRPWVPEGLGEDAVNAARSDGGIGLADAEGLGPPVPFWLAALLYLVHVTLFLAAAGLLVARMVRTRE
jgi:hypothetical protein